MESKGGSTIIVLVVVAIAGAALYFLAKAVRSGGGSEGGMFSQITGGIRGAMGLTQEVTENSVETGTTLGEGIAAGGHGLINLVDDAAHVGGSLNPANWDWPF